jgi:hypothetical protein
MNKKNLSIIIILAVLIGGIFFWQSSKKDVKNISNNKTDNVEVCNLSDCSESQSESQKVEKNLVEVFYLPHPPVDPIREKIKNILEKFPDYKLKEYDFYNDNNKQKIESYNLVGHIPVAIFIDGKDSFLINGQKITFKNFPKGDAFVPTLEGSWSYDDLEKVLANPDKYKDD